jgi:hypothetical protein
VEARWSGEGPTDFAEHIEAARMYLHFRALGNDPSAPFKPGAEWRFEQLRLVAETFGI